MRVHSSILLVLPVLLSPIPGFSSDDSDAAWGTVECVGEPHARHEAAFVACADRFHLLGGRRIQPVDILDPETNTWRSASPPPFEIHHFQPVTHAGKVYLLGAMTGGYPHETAVGQILVYDPAEDLWSLGDEIPEDRRRGGAGAVLHENTVYLVCGIINGHWDGNVAWLDAWDLETGEWRRLPDAPHARDHFQAVIIGDRIYAAGGRRTSGSTREVFNLTEAAVDVFDLKTGTWTTLENPIPTPRAGTAAIAIGHDLIVAGGESDRPEAHREVEALDVRTGLWRSLPSLVQARHGSGLVFHQGSLFIASGSGARGGRPELTTMERLTMVDPR
ncbi:MAG: kelch repeat-containing protein [Opitutaceae bacterium]